jgi:hypothetical protein
LKRHRSVLALPLNVEIEERAAPPFEIDPARQIPGRQSSTVQVERALRYYEQVGLLTPQLRVSGQRRYDLAVFDVLALIAYAKRVGFTIAETKVLLQRALTCKCRELSQCGHRLREGGD